MKLSSRTWWTILCLAVIAVLALQASATNEPVPRAATVVTVEQPDQTGEISGHLKVVNTEASALELEGIDAPIAVTPMTRFSGELALGELREGDKLRIVGVLKPDGKFEAREIYRAGAAEKPQQ